jgi:hypothetical protein
MVRILRKVFFYSFFFVKMLCPNRKSMLKNENEKMGFSSSCSAAAQSSLDFVPASHAAKNAKLVPLHLK